jgi:putative transposase
MLKTFQYRIYPSKAQEKRIKATLETCRRFYNACLEERKTAWEEEQRTINKYGQLKRVAVLKAESEFARPVHSHILQIVVSDLDKAFQAFFRRVKAGETPGYPRFKGRNRFNSFAFKEYGNGFKIDGRRLKLSGIGRVPVRWHREIEGTIKTARIIRKADGWYVSFACEVGDPVRLPETGSTIGIDVGLSKLITTSDGEQVAPPKHYRKMQAKFRRQQRKVSRRKKGGQGRRKAVKILACQHQVVERQRKDTLNKIVFNLVQRHDQIAVEDLKIQNLVKNRHLAKSIMDAGWGYFAQHLTFKAECAGREVQFVNPAYTSKMCSACGAIKEDLTLKDRTYVCPCGLRMDRDINAAINIRNKAFPPKTPAGRAGRDSSLAIAGLSLEAAGF